MKRIGLLLLCLALVCMSAACGGDPLPPAGGGEDENVLFRVTVMDITGKTVADYPLTFCLGDLCRPATTDAAGQATASFPTNSAVHVTLLPHDGYTASTTEATFAPGSTMLTLVVTPQDPETPDAGETNPDMGDTNPDAGETDPDTGDTNPDAGETNPDTGDTNPDAGETNPSPPPEGTAIGNTCPDVRVEPLGEPLFSLHANRGKVTVLNFFATWCPGCVAEMPYLSRLAGEYADRVTVVALHVDDITTLRQYVENGYADSAILFAQDAAAYPYYYRFADGYLPYTVIVDGEGVITHSFSGGCTYEEWVALVTEAGA